MPLCRALSATWNALRKKNDYEIRLKIIASASKCWFRYAVSA